MTHPVRYPAGGCWPPEMRSDMAAAYCDEGSVEAFLGKVAKGIYPNPQQTPACQPKWHRAKLDHAIARRHGLVLETAPPGEDLTELV
jgi:hypothetical protein